VVNLSHAQLARIDREADREARRIQREIGELGGKGKCRVCQYPDSLKLVNRLLAHGIPWGDIVDNCAGLNLNRPKNAQITYSSVRWHAKHHFHRSHPAQAGYRRILERRAAEHGQDMADGAYTLLTVWGYLEVMAQKGYQNLVKNKTAVTPELGMQAILKLHDLTRKGGDEAELAELRRQVGVLQQAVRDVVPEELWTEIATRIDEIYNRPPPTSSVLDAEVVDEEGWDDDEPYDPVEESDPEDTLGDD
jgi:hypothetical protein